MTLIVPHRSLVSGVLAIFLVHRKITEDEASKIRAATELAAV